MLKMADYTEHDLSEATFSLSTFELLEPNLILEKESTFQTVCPTNDDDSPKDDVLKPIIQPKELSLSTKISKEASKLKANAPLISNELVDCQYKAAGCKEKLASGTLTEKEHHQNCQFRPIPCLMQHSCSEQVPYHNFLLHHMKHFLHPTFAATLTTSVFFEREDFHHNQRWNPRWINCYERDFFVMLSHKVPGMWYAWIWMLGTAEEAANFSYEIEICKGGHRKLGTFPVLSVRTTMDEIEVSESCLSMTDYQVKRISQIRDNVIGCMGKQLQIFY